MALKATVFKVTLDIADMDRHYYAQHKLTLARHPSENNERMMVRLLAFALNASDTLKFTRGLCVDEEPELWQKDLQDHIELWIELGQPDERRLRKACTRADRVIVYTYQARSATAWWKQMGERLAPLDKLSVYPLPQDSVQHFAALVTRNMVLHCTVEEGEIWFSNGESDHRFHLGQWQ